MRTLNKDPRTTGQERQYSSTSQHDLSSGRPREATSLPVYGTFPAGIRFVGYDETEWNRLLESISNARGGATRVIERLRVLERASEGIKLAGEALELQRLIGACERLLAHLGYGKPSVDGRDCALAGGCPTQRACLYRDRPPGHKNPPTAPVCPRRLEEVRNAEGGDLRRMVEELGVEDAGKLLPAAAVHLYNGLIAPPSGTGSFDRKLREKVEKYRWFSERFPNG